MNSEAQFGGVVAVTALSKSLGPRNGMLSKTELSRFGSGMLTDVFVDRPAGGDFGRADGPEGVVACCLGLTAFRGL